MKAIDTIWFTNTITYNEQAIQGFVQNFDLMDSTARHSSMNQIIRRFDSDAEYIENFPIIPETVTYIFSLYFGWFRKAVALYSEWTLGNEYRKLFNYEG